MAGSAAMILTLLRVVNSPFGRVLQAIREKRFRAEALGFRTVFHLTYANCIAALVAATDTRSTPRPSPAPLGP
ncbi:MAG: hypothetical protein NVSMB20_04700 [Bradyrhizobium sp.]